MLTRDDIEQPYRALMAIRFADLSSFPEASVTEYAWTEEPIRCYWSVITRCIEPRGSRLVRYQLHFFGLDGWEQEALVLASFDEAWDYAHELLDPVQPTWNRCELLLIRGFSCLDPTWLRPWGACT